ncbi:DUF4328 domain-containing protein [Streptomyces sp. NPDC021080]|uniref:DUF4328 domain-containing protein n=1 Tax=Streptomyces sp. NPDC021080 TaxID=3365110 RepID=UPI00379A3002
MTSGLPVPLSSFAPSYGLARLRSPVALGRAAAGALGLMIAVDLYSIWADFSMHAAIAAFMDGTSGRAAWQRVEAAESYRTAAGYAQTAAFLTTVGIYLNWFLRVRANAEVFDPFGHTMSRAWARWGWIAPGVNLWFPRRIMQEIWDASRPEGARSGYGLLNTWWTLWVVDMLARLSVPTPKLGADILAEMRAGTGRLVLTHALDIVTAVFAIAVVLGLTRMQERKACEDPVAAGG